MSFLKWLNHPLTYVYVVLAIFVAIGTITMAPSRYDPTPNDPQTNGAAVVFLLLLGLFAVRAGWSVAKIVGGSYSSAMTGKPEKDANKPFSFWDY